VLRVAAAAIALTLAIGPDAAVLCGLWCDQHAVAEAACPQHGDGAPSSRVAAAGDCCDATVVAVTAILPRDARGGLASPDGDSAIPARFRLAVRMAATVRPRHQPGPRWSLDARPLATALRI